ncbi:hypothetical protein Tco_0214092 [Tanacetum coccineum]
MICPWESISRGHDVEEAASLTIVNYGETSPRRHVIGESVTIVNYGDWFPWRHVVGESVNKVNKSQHREYFLWKDEFGCNFLWKEERVRLLATSLGASTTLRYSLRPSTPTTDSPGPSRIAECSNCKLLIGKKKVLEATLEMYMNPKQHTLSSTALLHQVKMDDPNITMEEYIRLEEEKAQKCAIVLNDALTSEVTLSCKPMVSPLNNNKIDFRISFDESDDEDYTNVYMAYPNPMDMAYWPSGRYPVFIFCTVYTTYSLSEYSVHMYQYAVSWDMDTVTTQNEKILTNIGGEFTNLEILKCWSLETLRRLFNIRILAQQTQHRESTEQISGEFLILILFNSRI